MPLPPFFSATASPPTYWLLLVVSVASIHPTTLERPHARQMRGSVVDVRHSTIRIRHKTGQQFALVVNAETPYRKQTVGTAECVRVGKRLMVAVLPAAALTKP
jgi:hypothetical protein